MKILHVNVNLCQSQAASMIQKYLQLIPYISAACVKTKKSPAGALTVSLNHI